MSAFIGNNIEGLIQITRRDTNERKLHNNTEIEPNSMTGESNSVLAKIKFLLNESVDVTFVADVQEWKNDWDLTTETGFSFFPTPIQTSSALGLDDLSLIHI